MPQPNFKGREDLPEPVVKWIFKHSRLNYWRVAPWCDLDDYKVRNKYGDPLRDEIDHPHFMELVITTFTRFIGDELRKNRIVYDGIVHLADTNVSRSEETGIDYLKGGKEGDQEFGCMISELPEKLRRVVEVYLLKPQSLRRLRSYLDRPDQTFADKLYQLTGVRFSEEEFETALRSYLWMRQRGLL